MGQALFSMPTEGVADIRLGPPHDPLATQTRPHTPQHVGQHEARMGLKIAVQLGLVGSTHDQQGMGLRGSRDGFTPILKQGAKLEKRKGKERRKVGRPIIHKGDPDDPGLTEKQRGRLKRRIANRESARRVRNRRQKEMEELQIRMDEVLEKNRQLQELYSERLKERNTLAGELEELRRKIMSVAADNQNMDAEVNNLRQYLQVKMSALEIELDRHEAAASSDNHASAFGKTTARPIQAMMSALPSQTAAIEVQNSEALTLFPSLNLDGRKEMELLPSVDLNALLELFYDPTP